MKKIAFILLLLPLIALGCNEQESEIKDVELVKAAQTHLSEIFGFDTSMIGIEVVEVQGDFARGKIDMGLDEDLPNEFLAHKSKDGWEVVQKWSKDFYCQGFDEYEFPQAMIADCQKPDEEFMVDDARAIQAVFANKYQKEIDEVIVRVDQYDAEHARGLVQFYGDAAGGMFLAVKVDGNWEVVVDGNGAFSCDSISQYAFPAEMITDCN